MNRIAVSPFYVDDERNGRESTRPGKS